MKIGILMTGHAIPEFEKDFGDYDKLFARLLAGHGFEFVDFDIEGGVFPPGPEAADGWLITGSRHGAYEDHPWIPPLEQLIRDIYADGRPLVGVCFGHQIIAQALGGKVEKFGGGWSVGRTTYEIDGHETALNAWHQDQVTEVPDGAEVIGSSDFCANAALLYGNKVYSVQPHPEFTAPMVDMLVKRRGKGVVPDALLAGASTQLDAPVDNADIAARMAAFFKRGA